MQRSYDSLARKLNSLETQLNAVRGEGLDKELTVLNQIGKHQDLQVANAKNMLETIRDHFKGRSYLEEEAGLVAVLTESEQVLTDCLVLISELLSSLHASELRWNELTVRLQQD